MPTERPRITLSMTDSMVEYLQSKHGEYWEKMKSDEARDWISLGFDLAVADFDFDILKTNWWNERRTFLARIAAALDVEPKRLQKVVKL